MEIQKNLVGNTLTMTICGRLDTTTAPQLEQAVSDLTDVSTLVFDLGKLEYISSAGLRVFLATHKKMMKTGSMVVKNANDVVLEIFEITGFADILNIE